jgi:hypothetical protein
MSDKATRYDKIYGAAGLSEVGKRVLLWKTRRRRKFTWATGAIGRISQPSFGIALLIT